MQDIEAWIDETRQFAQRLGAQATRLKDTSDSNLEEMTTAAQALIRIEVDGLPLMSDCMAMRVASAMGRSAGAIDPESAERLAPVADGQSQLAILTQHGGGPVIWAQQRDGLLEGVPPLPGKEGKVIAHLKWVESMNKSVVKGLDGVAEEIDQQDGSGAAKAKQAAKEVEEKANNPPQKQSFWVKVSEGLKSLIKWITE